MKSSEDEIWLTKVLNRDPGYEFETVDRYSHRLLCLAQSRMPNDLMARIDPADVVQSALLSFFTRNQDGDFRFDEAQDIWRLLAAITFRKLQKSIRFHHRHRRDVGREELKDSGMDREMVSPTASSIASLNESLDRIFSRLPETHQQVLKMRLEGHSIRDISEQLHVSTRTVQRGLSLVQKVAFEILEDR